MPSLEIGSGANPQPGYIHLDRHVDSGNRHLVDICGDAFHLPFSDGVFDSVLMFGVFEHFGIFEIQEVMLEVVRVLRNYGTFRFDVPDFDWFVERYLFPEKLDSGRNEEWILKSIFGTQDGPWNFHRWGWNEFRMRNFLMKPNWDLKSVELIGRIWRDPEPDHLIWECVK